MKAKALLLFCLFLAQPFLQAQDQIGLDPDSKEGKIHFTNTHNQMKRASEQLLIKGGNFNGEQIAAFLMDKTLVTVAQYEACVKAGVCAPPPDNGNWAATYNRRGDKNRPINEVNWFNAQAYCQWMDQRLPSASEWEWAARGCEAARLYPWGNTAPAANSACWLHYDGDTDTGKGTCPVGHTAISLDGIADMAGNVWEWTATFANADKTLVIMKGGAWYNDDPEKLKVTYKGHASPYHSDDASDGFRCVRSN